MADYDYEYEGEGEFDGGNEIEDWLKKTWANDYVKIGVALVIIGMLVFLIAYKASEHLSALGTVAGQQGAFTSGATQRFATDQTNPGMGFGDVYQPTLRNQGLPVGAHAEHFREEPVFWDVSKTLGDYQAGGNSEDAILARMQASSSANCAALQKAWGANPSQSQLAFSNAVCNSITNTSTAKPAEHFSPYADDRLVHLIGR